MAADSALAVVALGGNAIAEEGSSVVSQEAVVGQAMEQVASLIRHGYRVVLTHGNGRQVGDLLIQNDCSKEIVPPHPLHWCVAETQATIGLMISNALGTVLDRDAVPKRVVSVVTRVVVDPHDLAWQRPTKPVGPYCDEDTAREGMARGETWDQGERGWRRLVPSPEPKEILDIEAIRALLEANVIVVAAGGGGIPVTSGSVGFTGADAVIDKDLTGALLASSLAADYFVLATDVDGAMLHFGTSHPTLLGKLSNEELRGHMSNGHFPAGSMGPKVVAALRFIDGGGRRAVITSIHRLIEGLEGSAGTIVEPMDA